MNENMNKYREIRAKYDDEVITVYQAYNPSIAKAAVKYQKFVSPFKMERMTWIKPSFFWMMYRCGWGDKPGQEHVLAIDIKRSGFECALENSVLSHFEPEVYTSEEEWEKVKNKAPVRIQWDPERGEKLNRLDYRSIQIGLSGETVKRYVNDWIVTIEDITDLAQQAKNYFIEEVGEKPLLPEEKVYPLPEKLVSIIGAS